MHPYELDNYRNNKEEIKRLEEHYQELFTKATNIVQSYSNEPKPSNRSEPHGIEKEVILLFDITNKIYKLKRNNIEIEHLINKLPFKHRFILTEYIINNKSIGEIAAQTKKSYRHIQRLKAESLILYNETIKNVILT